MAQQLHTTADTGFLMILFLLSYILSSAPKFVRGIEKTRQTHVQERTITSRVISVGKYAIAPYVEAWHTMKNSVQAEQNPVLETAQQRQSDPTARR